MLDTVGKFSGQFDGKGNVEERAKLKGMLDNKRLVDAANEITVQTARIAKIMYFRLFVGEDMLEFAKEIAKTITTETKTAELKKSKRPAWEKLVKVKFTSKLSFTRTASWNIKSFVSLGALNVYIFCILIRKRGLSGSHSSM